MTMRVLGYQQKAFQVVDEWLAALVQARNDAAEIDAVRAKNPSLPIPSFDFTQKAWEILSDRGLLPPVRAYQPFVHRVDNLGQPVPTGVLKVPTGGGKTWLAVHCAGKMQNALKGSNVGLVLWVVPNEAIYSQTMRQLSDRDHPYRQVLERAGAGRVRVLDKGSSLHALDVMENLCVLVLMLQSANRETRDFLKIFQDTGRYHGFFPDEGDQLAHEALFERIPNLDVYQMDGSRHQVKDSLGNVLRLQKPIIILDEGHRATSDLARRTLEGFNPTAILELSATPAAGTNVLVEISGRELDSEGMIKMPLNLEVKQGQDWKTTLAASVARLNDLQEKADELFSNENRYIRPIMLVQVERTGKDQRDGSHIHADDVKDWLIQTGFAESAIAIKTAQQNDLKQPENLDLLSPTNSIRIIITKQALQEGWDNPFAYVLCSLAASSNVKAMTQLIGRILRQPHATKTGVEELDQCYVVTHHAETADVVKAVRKGLEDGGLGDLVRDIRTQSGLPDGSRVRTIHRRDSWESTSIYLPQVLVSTSSGHRRFDYETDILFKISWEGLDLSLFAERKPHLIRESADEILSLSFAGEGDVGFESKRIRTWRPEREWDAGWLTRSISDIVPNPWIAWNIVAQAEAALLDRGATSEQLGLQLGHIAMELRSWLLLEQDSRAEEIFRESLRSEHIQFRMQVSENLNWSMPIDYQVLEDADSHARRVQKSLFDPVFEDELNHEEWQVAGYLDDADTVNWWHRNLARNQYSVQGWRRENIRPDFVFSFDSAGKPTQVKVLETKGDHLSGNLDTLYKKAVLEALSAAYRVGDISRAGIMESTRDDGTLVSMELVLMSNWRSHLGGLLA